MATAVKLTKTKKKKLSQSNTNSMRPTKEKY